MDKSKEKELLKEALAEIPHLRALPPRNGKFTIWENKVLSLLESAYGKESAEYRRFVNAPGTTFAVRTEAGQRQNYDFRLDCYESVLQSLVS